MNGFPPSDKSAEGMWKDTLERVTFLERRLRGEPPAPFDGDLGAAGGLLTGSRLHPTYRGDGPALVRLAGETAYTGPYEWLGKFDPPGSRQVTMILDNGEWRILEQEGGTDSGAPVRVPITHANLLTYGEWNNVLGVYEMFDNGFQVQRTPYGIVAVSGLLTTTTGALNSGDTIGTLPEGFRPDAPAMFPVDAGSSIQSIQVLTDGRIQWSGTGPLASASYFSLDNIVFPAAGVATWTDVGAAGSNTALVNGWVNRLSGWPPAGYWKDAYGVVWWRGLVQAGTITDGTPIVNMSTGFADYRAPAGKQQHLLASSNGTFGNVGSSSINPTAIIESKGGNIAGGWLSLDGLGVLTPSSYTVMTWRTPPRYLNGWVANDTAAQSTFMYTRRGDGLVMTVGLMRAGTIGNQMVGLPDHVLTKYRKIIAAASGNARGRADLWSRNDASDTRGAFTPSGGTNAWFSFDNMKWIPN